MPVKEEIGEDSSPGRRSLLATQLLAVACLAIVILGIGYTLTSAVLLLSDGRWLAFSEILLFLLMAILLSYGTLTYVLGRIGYIRRIKTSLTAEQSDTDIPPADDKSPSITVMVPSYREELDVVRKTLLSAALQQNCEQLS